MCPYIYIYILWYYVFNEKAQNIRTISVIHSRNLFTTLGFMLFQNSSDESSAEYCCTKFVSTYKFHVDYQEKCVHLQCVYLRIILL